MSASYEREDFLGDKYIEHEDGSRSYRKKGLLGDDYIEHPDGSRSYERKGLLGDDYIEHSDGSTSRYQTDLLGEEYIEHDDGRRSYRRTGIFGDKYWEHTPAIFRYRAFNPYDPICWIQAIVGLTVIGLAILIIGFAIIIIQTVLISLPMLVGMFAISAVIAFLYASILLIDSEKKSWSYALSKRLGKWAILIAPAGALGFGAAYMAISDVLSRAPLAFLVIVVFGASLYVSYIVAASVHRWVSASQSAQMLIPTIAKARRSILDSAASAAAILRQSPKNPSPPATNGNADGRGAMSQATPQLHARLDEPKPGSAMSTLTRHTCFSCNADVTEEDATCPDCGAELGDFICSVCNASVPMSADVCPSCGADFSVGETEEVETVGATHSPDKPISAPPQHESAPTARENEQHLSTYHTPVRPAVPAPGKRYGVLRFIGFVSVVVGVLLLAAGGVAGLFVVAALSEGQGLMGLSAIPFVVICFVLALPLLAANDLVQWLVNMDQHAQRQDELLSGILGRTGNGVR